MCLTQWLDILRTIAIVAGAGVAFYGIWSWRTELSGKLRYQLAEEALSLFYQSRDLIRAIRNPMGGTEEGKTRKENPAETPDQKRAFDQAYVLWERYLRHQEVFSRINTLRYRFMAVFGKTAAKPFEMLDDIIRRFVVAVQILGNAWHRAGKIGFDSPEMDALTKSIQEQSAVFWEGYQTPDQISALADDMIKEIEKICVPVLIWKLRKRR